MKTLANIFILLVVIFVSVSCITEKKIPSSTSISHLSDDGIKEGGIVYSLPMTVLSIRVDMERVVEVPGPYARYAADLLGLTKVIMNENESWSVKGIKVNSHEEADPSEYYVIESNTLIETNALALKREGLILDLNPAIYSYGRSLKSENENDAAGFQTFDMGSNEYFKVQRDTAYRRVDVDSTFIRIPYLLEKKRRLTTDQLAEKAAMRLMELREGKILILTGESNVFPQHEAALNELNRLEKEYIELFAGKTWRETKSISFQVVPKKEMTGNPVALFRFSEETGPLTGAVAGGAPVTIELVPEQRTKDLTVVSKPKSEETEEAAPVFDKLFYRVPDIVNIRISSGNETFFTSRMLVYQFGKVIELPANYIIGK